MTFSFLLDGRPQNAATKFVADFVADFVAGAFSVKWKKSLNFTKSPKLMSL
jgi:hypothetical protein